jgi:transposase
LSALPEASDGVKVSRRSWPLEEKRRIVEEAFRPGMSVADVARRHGLNSNQVFNWRKVFGTRPAAEISEASSSASSARSAASPSGTSDGFLSIGAIAETKDEGAVPQFSSSTLLVGQAPPDRGADARPAMDERPGMIEIDLPCGTRLLVDAFVNERALRRVLCVLRSLS